MVSPLLYLFQKVRQWPSQNEKVNIMEMQAKQALISGFESYKQTLIERLNKNETGSVIVSSDFSKAYEYARTTKRFTRFAKCVEFDVVKESTIEALENVQRLIDNKVILVDIKEALKTAIVVCENRINQIKNA